MRLNRNFAWAIDLEQRNLSLVAPDGEPFPISGGRETGLPKVWGMSCLWLLDPNAINLDPTIVCRAGEAPPGTKKSKPRWLSQVAAKTLPLSQQVVENDVLVVAAGE